jgi:hypothetical protein
MYMHKIDSLKIWMFIYIDNPLSESTMYEEINAKIKTKIGLGSWLKW